MTPSRRRESGASSVHIHVRELDQLYNALDPSPFWDRDLDRNAAEFIEGEFRDRLGADHWHLVVHVTADEADTQTLQTAVTSYYKRLAASARRELKEHLQRARLGLLAGLALFAIMMAARTLLKTVVHGLPAVVDEGLIILAWLSLWRPAETMAYEWLPLHRRHRLYQRLSAIKVTVHATPPLPTPTAVP